MMFTKRAADKGSRENRKMGGFCLCAYLTHYLMAERVSMEEEKMDALLVVYSKLHSHWAFLNA